MKKSHGVDQEDNSEWFKTYDKKAVRKQYGDLTKIVGQRDFREGRQELNAAIEGDDA